MTEPNKAFIGKCPTCGSYHNRIRTELLSYGDSSAAGAAQPVSSRTRVYLCNACAHIWSETVPGDDPQSAPNRSWGRIADLGAERDLEAKPCIGCISGNCSG